MLDFWDANRVVSKNSLKMIVSSIIELGYD